jgi:hypothetical protein
MKIVDLDLNEPPSFQAPGACHQVVLGKIRGIASNVDAGRSPVRDRYGPACRRIASTWRRRPPRQPNTQTRVDALPGGAMPPIDATTSAGTTVATLEALSEELRRIATSP